MSAKPAVLLKWACGTATPFCCPLFAVQTLGRYAAKFCSGKIVSQLLHHKVKDGMSDVSERYTDHEWTVMKIGGRTSSVFVGLHATVIYPWCKNSTYLHTDERMVMSISKRIDAVTQGTFAFRHYVVALAPARVAVMLALGAIFSGVAPAMAHEMGGDSSSSSFPRWEFGLGYAHMPTDGEERISLNGPVVSAFYNINSLIGLGGEYSHLRGSTTIPFDLGQANDSQRRDVWLLGPRFNFHPGEKVTLFVDTLFGRVRDRSKFTFDGSTGDFRATGTAFKLGGGIDYCFNSMFCVTGETAWIPARFNGVTFSDQFRVQAGIRLYF